MTEDDWHSNLQNWKQTRKSQSSYQRVQDVEDEDEAHPKTKSKTYKEMIEERQRRKSSHDVHGLDDYADGSFEYEPSKARAVSNEDLCKPDENETQEHKSFSELTSTPKRSSESRNFNNEEDSYIKKTKEIKMTTEPVTTVETTSDNRSHRFNNSFLPEVPVHKIDANVENNSRKDGKNSANFSNNRDKFEIGNRNLPPAKSLNEVKYQTADGGSNVADRLKMWNKPVDVAPHMKTTETKKMSHMNNARGGGGGGDNGAVRSNSSNMFFEKIIRINQRPNHEKGFGFTIAGGREFNSPIVVDKVVRGGSADICELKAGDEIIAISGAEVGNHYSKSVQSVLEQSVITGTIELKIKRLKDLDDEFEEEVFSDDDMKLIGNKRVSQFSDSMSSQWSSPPSSPPSVADISDDLLPPPPLPSVPPPPPNWNTFPSEVAMRSDDASKSDASFFIPDSPFQFKTGNQNDVNQSNEIPDVSKEDILRRKSQFLGLKLEESQEFKALQEEKEKKLKQGQMNSIDFTNSFSISHLPDLPVPLPPPSLPDDHLRGKIVTVNKSYGSFVEEDREKEKLREKEDQLRRKEEMMNEEKERLRREKERMERESEERLSVERERLKRENERQLQQERERLSKENDEQLRLEREILRRETKEDSQRQNERQLKLEFERLEREKEQQLFSEKERLKREKEEEIRREKERMQRERERQEAEQEKRRAEQEIQIRKFSDNGPLSRGFTLGHEPSARKPSVEPSESEVAEYGLKYGGKTFARLAAQTRSESVGEFNIPKSAPKADAGNFLKTDPNFGKSVGRKFDRSDKNANFSSVRSNFERGNTPNASTKDQDHPVSWNHPDGWQPRAHEQYEGLVHHNRSNTIPSLGAKSMNPPPQVGLRTTSLAPSYGDPDTFVRPPMERQSATLGSQIPEDPRSQKFGPQIVDQMSAFGSSLNPEISERKTSLRPHFGDQNERENENFHDRYNQKPFEQVKSTRPQNKENPLREEHLSHKTQPGLPRNADPSNPSSHSNLSYLLYGDDAGDLTSKHVDGIGLGGYNSQAFNPHGIPSSPSLPSFSESKYPQTNGQMEKSSVRQSGTLPSNSLPPTHQFNESWPSTKTSALPNSRNADSDSQRKASTLGPRPFESSAWKQSAGNGDHWLVEEAERMRIAELTGEQRAWSMGQEARRHAGPALNHPSGYSSSSHQTLPSNRGYSDHGAVPSEAPRGGAPLKKSSVSEFHLQKSSCSVPEPVKQTLLTRINTGSSRKSISPLSPLPSYPLSHSHAPPSHSRSVSSPLADLDQFPLPGASFPVVPRPAVSPSYPPHGGAIDSLFAYHHQAIPSGTNLVSQRSLSRSQGSLHLDGTPQYTDVRTQRTQGSYQRPFHPGDGGEQRSNSYAVLVRDPGRVVDSFPRHCQPVVQNLLCSVCQRPLAEIGGKVAMKDGDLRLRCQNCSHENEVKYSKV